MKGFLLHLAENIQLKVNDQMLKMNETLKNTFPDDAQAFVFNNRLKIAFNVADSKMKDIMTSFVMNQK